MKHLNPTADSDNRSCVLLIDLDNCPHEILDLAETAQRYDVIVAAHGSREPRVPLGVAAVLGQLVTQGKIEIWAMPPGKNAADFGITFVAGRLSAEMPARTSFHIASQDRDLEHAVGLLKRSGFQARRIDSSNQTKATKSAKTTVGPNACRLASSLSGRGANSRPKRRRTLESVAKARCATPDAGIAALKELEATGAIRYGAKTIPEYDNTLLKNFAALAPTKKQKTEPLLVQKLVESQPPKPRPDQTQLELFD